MSKIIGVTVGTPALQSDWNQTDPNRVDYIKNKPDLSSLGKDGKDGENGATFTPYISADGTLSWENDKGLPNPDDLKIKGDDGYTPLKGLDYFTESDITNIVDKVCARIGDGNGVSY